MDNAQDRHRGLQLPAILAAGLVLIGISFVLWQAGRPAGKPPQIASAWQITPTPFLPAALTQTPFHPVGPTPTATTTSLPTATPFPASFVRFGIDFSDTSRAIKTRIEPASPGRNSGHAVRIDFTPGWPCEWINRRACTSLHYRGQVVLISIHSGIAGDGQGLRHAIEGTWLNSAGFSLDRIQENVSGLVGSPGSMEQGEAYAGDIIVVGAARVPAARAEEYFSLPVDDAIDLAAEYSPQLAEALASRRPLIIFETCGWRVASEGNPAGTTDTSASVYLVALSQ